MDKVIILADHVIGQRLANYLLNRHFREKDDSYKIIYILGNATNENTWWPSLKELALLNGIEYADYSPLILKDIVNKNDCNWMLLLSWKHIMPADILSNFKGDVVNLHYSLLPRHRGVYPVNWAIQSGDRETGISFHFVDAAIDAGKIIEQRKIIIDQCDDAKSLLYKLDDLAYESFLSIWDKRSDWKINAFEQTGQPVYNSRKDFERTNEIDLFNNTDTAQLIRLLRAKTFGDKSAAYYIDETTGKKIYISVNLYP